MKNPSSSGYSGTPLVKKLGIQEGFLLLFINQPAHYFDLVGKFPNHTRIVDSEKAGVDFVHLFAHDAKSLRILLPRAKNCIVKNGMIWVSWPKKSSKVPTDLDENIIREYALEIGLVDVKVCAVDEVWSGLKLVYRLKDR